MTRKKRTRHSLVLTNRGAEHIHTFAPSCPCGWKGVPGRRPWAEEQYHDHVRFEENLAARARENQHRAGIRNGKYRGRRRARGAEPRPVTPPEDLPEALR